MHSSVYFFCILGGGCLGGEALGGGLEAGLGGGWEELTEFLLGGRLEYRGRELNFVATISVREAPLVLPDVETGFERAALFMYNQ